ncbi:MAG: hypothetical protein DWQ02_06650 [Bacteroidetes bacterium]|nr:MAG: hypothetical protein DWQ02_06650 [Bacteroidota bacterium]
MEKVKLRDLAEIRSGYSFRKKVTNNVNGDVSIIQMRDLIHDYTDIKGKKDLFKVSSTDLKKGHLLKQGDILFLAKGTNNKAIVFKKKYEAIATLTFFIISINQNKKNKFLPSYLAWYINQDEAQRYFEKVLVGTSQRNINSNSLRELEIPILSLEKQKIISELSKLIDRENQLLDLLKEKKEILIRESLLKLF